MKYFLAKTDPETYSIDDLEREKKTAWDGVTNPQAVRAIREMRPGDRVFVYHSGGVSGVVGLATVRSEPRDDPKNPKSAVVDLEYGGRLDPPTTLAEIKQSGKFDDWALVRLIMILVSPPIDRPFDDQPQDLSFRFTNVVWYRARAPVSSPLSAGLVLLTGRRFSGG